MASAGTNMVFVLSPEFYAPDHKELPVARLDFGLRPVIFEKPREKNYKHLKALYLKGYINSHPFNKMLVDTGAAVNVLPYSVLRRLGHSAKDLIKTNVTLSDFNGQALEAQGILNVDLTMGSKTVPTGKQDCPNFLLHCQQQEYIHCHAQEGLDSCQLLHPFYDAPMSNSVGW
jgi:hypothetical protein